MASVLVALSVGWIFTQGDNTRREPVRSYRATTTVISSSTLSGLSAALRGPTNLQTIAALATLGEVPRRVAETLEYEGDPGELTASVLVTADPATGLLSIAATAPSSRRAILLADTFAEELMGFLRDRNLALGRSMQERVDEIDQDIEDLDRQIAATADEEEERSLVGQRDGLELERGSLTQQIAQITAARENASGLEIIERATATPIAVDPGLLAPRSRTLLILLAAIVGLILGAAIALLLERFDSRIQTKDEAEEAFKLPVIGEVPVIPRRRRGAVVAGAFPHAPASNAFRLIAAALQFGRRGGLAGVAASNGERAWRMILVTSAAPSEGKSTTVANLAATFADIGKRVTILCCDFRHPSLHGMLGIEPKPGLSDALVSDGEMQLEGLLQETKLEGVRGLSTGAVPDNASALFGSDRLREVLHAARATADIVLIDTAPVLAASDWTQLVPDVEAVLVVARAGKTGAAAAARTAEILTTLQAPVVGIVLNQVPRSLIRGERYGFGIGYGGYGASRTSETEATERGGESDLAEVRADGEGEETGARSRDGGIPHLTRHSAEE